ncbi:MAG: HNH endonuclease, partial [Chitinophagales bacterium]
MINIAKSSKPDRDFSYKERAIRDIVKGDFYSICYLCEEVTPRHYEIDHFYPQKYYEHLIDEWDNLFFICQKCNKIRPKNINTCSDDEVLNNCEDDVENLLTIYYDSHDESVFILPNTIDPKVLYRVENTIRLLNRIYNGIDTTSLSYIDLRNEIEET